MTDHSPLRSERLRLSDVTLCAADSVFVDLTARALTLSMAQCDFGDAILFSDVAKTGPFRTVRIAPLMSIEDYSRFCLHDLAGFIRTPFVLIVQWDGYVVDAEAWRNAFYKYDYIGAAWHGLFPDRHLVGNGGLSLRSRRLLQAAGTLPAAGGHPEDQVISRVFRPVLERNFGIRFAPIRVADQFSYEVRIPERPTFGFHGLLHLSRYYDDDELAALVERIQIDRIDSNKLMDLVLASIREGRSKSARALYERLAQKHPRINLKGVLDKRIGGASVDERFATVEALYGKTG